MATLAVLPKGSPRKIGLVFVYGYQGDLCLGNEQVGVANTIRAIAVFKAHRRFNKRCSGQRARLGCFDRLVEFPPLWLVLKKRQDGRGINNHQRGSPCSSYPMISSVLRVSRTGR